MSIDLGRARTFMASRARVLDRRRFETIIGEGESHSIVDALSAYRNPDGGYGWGVEPDLRAPESQPAGAMHALEALDDAGPQSPSSAGSLLDWLDTATLPDGGLPFALPVRDPAATAPLWVESDPTTSSLQITAAVAARAHRIARWDGTVRDHPWLARATRYCLASIEALEEPPFAYVLAFGLQFLDAASDSVPEALAQLERLIGFVPRDGAIPVAGGLDGESLHLLEYAPDPDRPIRGLLDPQAVSDDLDRLEQGQRDDGGWSIDFMNYSDAAALEWRGNATVNAIRILRRNGR